MGAGGTGNNRRKGGGDGGGGRGRGEQREVGVAVGGNRQKQKPWNITYLIKYIREIESSVPMASVLGLKLHHQTMSTLWGHRDRSKRKKDHNSGQRPKILCKCFIQINTYSALYFGLKRPNNGNDPN